MPYLYLMTQDNKRKFIKNEDLNIKSVRNKQYDKQTKNTSEINNHSARTE